MPKEIMILTDGYSFSTLYLDIKGDVVQNYDCLLEDEFTYRVYLWLDDGYLNKEYSPTYCDMGYIFDEKIKFVLKIYAIV